MDSERREQLFEVDATGEPTPSATSAPNRAHPGEATPQHDQAELVVLVRRMERMLEEIRGRFETVTRARRHREFSPARLIGAVLQALVIGFVIAALADWAYQAAYGEQIVKLLFASVFQLGALTAFVLARGKD